MPLSQKPRKLLYKLPTKLQKLLYKQLVLLLLPLLMYLRKLMVHYTFINLLYKQLHKL